MAIAASAALASTSEIASAPFSTGTLRFSVRFRGESSPYRLLAATALPDEELAIEAQGSEGPYTLEASQGAVRRRGSRSWLWRAPHAPGLYRILISNQASGETAQLNAFVLVPASSTKQGILNGYRIGQYPSKPLQDRPVYLPPRGFIEVTAENAATPVSPHFRLDQFLCKQSGDFPKYVVLRERLLLKLELLLARANAAGYRSDTFHIMSGYRTPSYNRAIGNVQYSRHIYGGAADIFIDQSPRDGEMDDLNGDGRVDVEDASVLYDLLNGVSAEPEQARFLGGLGRYDRTAVHGPFVHIDARGWRARWGR